MVKRLQTQQESLYGLPQPTVNQFPTPVVARRDPTVADTGYILGQIWVNKVTATFFGLGSVSGGATWLSLGGSLTPAVASLTTGAAATSTLLAGNVWSATGSNAAIDLVLTPKGVGGVQVSTGALTVTAGNIVATLGNIIATAGNVEIATAGDGLQVAEGVNGRMGTSVLVAGTRAIAIASVGANTRVFLSRSALNASPALGFLTADTSVPGTLTVNSYDATGVLAATDVSRFNYLCIEAI